jgi:hypothetical protein
MLKEVADKSYVNPMLNQSAKVHTGALDDLHARIGVSSNFLTDVERDSPTADNVIDELAIPCANIEDRISVADVTLEEVVAQHSPHAILSSLLVKPEPQRVESREIRITHIVRHCKLN